MTHYADLSPYEYVKESVPAAVTAVNVGWLEPGEEYPQGDVPDGFVEALATIVRDSRQMKMRGWHGCGLPHVGYTADYPIRVDVGGQKVALGGAEVRVVARSGEWMIAPDLILHYVSDHSYKPPADFIDAVLDQRIAPAV
jgi:hypothetical protein